MTYVSFLNGLFKEEIAKADRLVMFGQNITLGSCLGGLCRDIKVKENSLIINSPNVENTLVGLGFGAMMSGVSAIFFVKQLDFVLLGIDPLVNTYNYVRRFKPSASFTIVPTIVDLPYQGLQSSLNNLPDFCSIARVPGYVITNKHDAQDLIRNELIKPGFRFLCPSNRFYKEPVMEFESVVYRAPDYSVYQFEKGEGATIISFNFTLPQARNLAGYFRSRGSSASLFNVTLTGEVDWSPILKDALRTRRLIVLDDTKGTHFHSDQLVIEALKSGGLDSLQVLKRDLTGREWLAPNKEILELDMPAIYELAQKKNIGGVNSR